MRTRSTKKKAIRNATKTILVVGIIILISLLFYIREKNKYENVFYNDTVINEVDCSSLTIEEAKAAIQKEEQKYEIEIVFKDNEVERISGAEINLSVDNLKKELESIKEQQRKKIFFIGETYNLTNFSFDKEKLKTVLLNKRQLQNDYMKEKTKITYVFNTNKKLFEVEEQDVYYLDFNQVFEVVSNAIEKREAEISMGELYSIHETNHVLQEMNSLVSAEITYQLPQGIEYVLDANTLHKWLVQNENGEYVKDEEVWNEKIEDLISNGLSAFIDNEGKAREFKPTGKDETVIVEGGNYGYVLDTETEIQKLKDELERNEIVNREPCYLKKEVSNENYGLGDSYVEIDLTRQKVWVYVNGLLEIETDCVTGCINKGHETPTGIFTLTYKEKDRTLRGKALDNGKYEYESDVNYWMPFNGGIGLHDATWRSSFGGNIYVSNGSHGCINLPLEKAEKLYEVIDYDMPIIVYKS